MFPKFNEVRNEAVFYIGLAISVLTVVLQALTAMPNVTTPEGAITALIGLITGLIGRLRAVGPDTFEAHSSKKFDQL